MKSVSVILLSIILFANGAFAPGILLNMFLFTNTASAEVAITVYNSNLGLVREVREFEFSKGVGEIRFTDVAAQIIPTSVHFNSDRANLLEQNYEYDLVDSKKLLNKFIDQQVQLNAEGGELFVGNLLSASRDIVLQASDGSIRSITAEKVFNVHFPVLPEGLITRPTLVWMVESRKGGKGTGEVSYLTNGISWQSEYVAVTDEHDKSLELTGWVNITNNSGATYHDARIKLMAGDVQVIPEYGAKKRYRATMAMESVDAAAPQFEEQAFYEYHLYTLQRPATIRDNQVKQLSLFPAASVKSVIKEYRYEPNRYHRRRGDKNKVKVTLVYKNSEKNGLGIPLPKGKVRVYKEGPDGGLEFVGEDVIDHTPRNEELRISTGNAFDIVGERRETDTKQRGREKEIEFKIRNHKDEKVEVIVAENIYGDWEIIESTPGWEKKRSDLIEWKVKLAPDEEKVLEYRVIYHY